MTWAHLRSKQAQSGSVPLSSRLGGPVWCLCVVTVETVFLPIGGGHGMHASQQQPAARSDTTLTPGPTRSACSLCPPAVLLATPADDDDDDDTPASPAPIDSAALLSPPPPAASRSEASELGVYCEPPAVPRLGLPPRSGTPHRPPTTTRTAESSLLKPPPLYCAAQRKGALLRPPPFPSLHVRLSFPPHDSAAAFDLIDGLARQLLKLLLPLLPLGHSHLHVLHLVEIQCRRAEDGIARARPQALKVPRGTGPRPLQSYQRQPARDATADHRKHHQQPDRITARKPHRSCKNPQRAVYISHWLALTAAADAFAIRCRQPQHHHLRHNVAKEGRHRPPT